MFRVIATALAVLVGRTGVQAQPAPPALDPEKAITQYLHDVWQIDEGMPQNSVEAVLQTRDGYLWLGTEEGLARFNGIEFDVFDRRNTAAFGASQWIRTLFEDRGGNLWIGTNEGGVIRYREGTFVRHRAPQLAGQEVNAFAEDRAGTLWVGTWGGLYACRGETCARFTVEEGLPSNQISALYLDRRERLWVGTEDGLCRIAGGAIERFSLGAEADEPPTVAAFREDAAGRLWIGTREDGLYRMDRHGGIELLSGAEGWPADVWSIWEDAASSLWFGTSQGGLVRYHDGALARFTTRDGLSHARVLALYGDREGSLWIGTDGGGLNRLRDAKLTTFTTNEGLSGNHILTLYEDAAGTVWIGTEAKGLNRLREKTITHVTDVDTLAAAFITSVYEDQEGALWIGTLDDGLYRLQNDSVNLRLGTREGLPSHDIYALYQDSKGALWIGTEEGLARRRDGQLKTFTVEDGLSSNSITAILEDHEGILWAGTYDAGLNRYDGERFAPVVDEDSLLGNIIMALHEDAEGTLWVGTYGDGLFRLQDGELTEYTTRDGLFDNTVYQVLEDDQGHLWMGSNKGIFRVALDELNAYARGEIETLTSASFGRAEGMVSREVNGGVQPAGWKSRDGRLWFPTVEGVVVVDPDNLETNHVPPPVVIEEVEVDNEPASPYEPELVLAPGTERVEIAYAALTFIAPGRVRYRYRLEGFDTAWNEADASRRVATYTHLDPGAYRFQVLAMNGDGVWNETGATIAFQIRPFFYETTLFWVWFLCSVALVGYGGYRVRVRHLEARQRQLQDLVTARTSDLQTAKEHIEAQADVLRDSLREKEVLLKEVHHRVKNNLQIISSLLHLQAAKVGDRSARDLFKECQDRVHSMAAIHKRLYESDNLAEIDFGDYLRHITDGLMRSYRLEAPVRLEVDADRGLLSIDQAIPCGLIVNELVSNALKYAFPEGRAGTLVVRFRDEGVQYRLLVEDDGQGLPESFSVTRSPSLGLKLVTALVKKLRGRLVVRSPQVLIPVPTNNLPGTDPDEADRPDQGTVFEITFPA